MFKIGFFIGAVAMTLWLAGCIYPYNPGRWRAQSQYYAPQQQYNYAPQQQYYAPPSGYYHY